MRWALGLGWLVVGLGALPWAWGREWVVAQDHPQASDENPGTAERPFKTISRAAQGVEPGDVVVVKAGLYREGVALRRSGRPGQPILFVADPPGSVVITGADPIDGWERMPGEEPIYRVPWPHRFVIDHLPDGTPVEHHPRDCPLWGRAEQVIVDGHQLLPTENLEALRETWRQHQEARKQGEPLPALKPPLPNLGGPFAGRFAVDTRRKELYLWLADGSDPGTHRVEASTRPALFGLSPWERREGVAHVQVRGFVFRYGATFPQRAAVWLHGQENLLEDCLIEEMAGGGVLVHGTMRRCIVRRCGHTGGGASGHNFLNEECLWEGNSWKPIPRGWDAGGFKMAGANGGVFRRCLFRRNGGPGLWLDIHVRHVLISECIFQGNEGSGLFIEISRDITVVRNLFVENGVGVVGEAKWPNWSIGGLQLAESMNCVVASNTCVGNKDGITLREQGPRLLHTEDFGEVPYHNRGHIIVGNVCAFNRGYQLGLWYDNGFFGWHPAEREKFKTEEAYQAFLEQHPEKVFDPTQQDILIDRNLYFADKGQRLILYGVEWRPKHRVFLDLAPFVALTGFDRRSRVADPLFVGREAGDYRFRPESPAWALQAGWLQVPPLPPTQG